MRNACEHRAEISKIVFGNEILNVPQSSGKSYNTMYRGSKSELTSNFLNIQSIKFQKRQRNLL